jgi:uncharacterized membrane protein YhaH (DUF805 family)
MPNSIIRGFASVFRFRGRETRSEFWPYAGVAVALYLVVGWAVLIPIMLPVLNASFSDHFGSFLKMESHFLLASVLMFAALVAILAAAVARRLHDSGRSAFWGLLPLPFVVYSGTMFFRLFSQFDAGEPDIRLFLSVLVSHLLYFVAVALLIVLLALRSTPGPNRFG